MLKRKYFGKCFKTIVIDFTYFELGFKTFPAILIAIDTFPSLSFVSNSSGGFSERPNSNGRFELLSGSSTTTKLLSKYFAIKSLNQIRNGLLMHRPF